MPPSAIVASKAMANDPRAEPKYCERVPYVVVAGPVGARLMDLVSPPKQRRCFSRRWRDAKIMLVLFTPPRL